MKKFVVCFRTVMYLLTLTLALQSCDKDDDPVINDKGQVLAVIYDNAELDENHSDPTKTAPKTVWLQGDAIGVFCVEPGKSLGKVNFASNKKYVYNNGKFEPAAESDKIWISREGTFKFYAYYPYSTSQTGVDIDGRALEFKVATDQTSDANRTKSDIIAGKSTTVDNMSGEVDMDFYHMMSDIRFSWTRADSDSKEYVNALFGTTAVINLADLTSAQKSGEKPGAGIKMNIKNAYNASTGSTEFQVFVPPTTISNGQDLFVPYDAGGKPLAAIKANLGSTPTQVLDKGKTYDLAGNMYTITADVRRNGDLVPEKCDSYDGCVVNATGGGDSQQLKKFVGRYLNGRDCQITSVMGTGLPLGTQFIGWFEYNDQSKSWTKIEGAGETYKFTVNKNRRLQARYENYVYTPWEITWNSPVTSGATTPTITIGANDASSRSVTLRATRKVTLDGETVTDPSLTTRENKDIVLRVQESKYVPAGNKDRFNEPAWTYTESSKTIKSTANSDESGGTTVARKLVAHVVIDGQDMYTTADKGGALDNPIDHSKVAQSTYLLTVNQAKGTVSFGNNDDNKWSVLIENAADVNTKMDAKGTVNGATVGSFDAYIYRPRKVAGVVVEIETVPQANVNSAFSSNADSHWGISSEKKVRTFPAAQFGHDFANKEGAAFKVTNKNNKTESERSQTITISSTTSGDVKGTTQVKQKAGVKTNRTWTDYVIELKADPTTLQVIASNGNANTSVVTTSASRKMNYDWNNITADKGEDTQPGAPKLSMTQGAGYAALSGSNTGSRVSVQNNYDATTLGKPTADRNVVITATIANTEAGRPASTKTVTITQKGGTVTERRDPWTTGSISTGGSISAYGGSTTISRTLPTRLVHVILDGQTELTTYTETAVFSKVTSSSNTFTVSGTSSVSAGANLTDRPQVTVNGSWTGGSVSISTSSFGRTGGSTTISWVNPTSSSYKRYDTSARSATLTGHFTFNGSALENNSTATTSVNQNGCTDKVPDTEFTDTAGNPTLSENTGWSSISGTTLSISDGTSTSTEYSIGSGSLSISGSLIAAKGGTATANPSKPSCSWTEYYDAVNRSGTVTAKWTEGNISRTTGFNQSASRSQKDSGSGTATTGSVSWPSWCPGGTAGENTGSERSGTVSVTFTYNGKSSTATATVRQSGAVITYGDYRITVSPTSMTWKGDSESNQSYTVTGYRTKYINGKKGSEEKVSVSGISVSCSGDFSGNSNYIYPDGTNETENPKTGTATVTATPSGGTACKATISLRQEVRDWTVTD